MNVTHKKPNKRYEGKANDLLIEVYKEKVNTRDELIARIMNGAALIKQERQDDLRRATRTLPRELKSALKSMVGFLNTYFELLQFIEIIYIINKCNQ